MSTQYNFKTGKSDLVAQIIMSPEITEALHNLNGEVKATAEYISEPATNLEVSFIYYLNDCIHLPISYEDMQVTAKLRYENMRSLLDSYVTSFAKYIIPHLWQHFEYGTKTIHDLLTEDNDYDN